MSGIVKERTVQVLEGAREKVRRGWVQGMGQTADGRKVCAAQAIGLMAHELSRYQGDANCTAVNAQTFFMIAIREQTGQDWSIPDWNDSPGRTQAEVIDCFDHAIKLVERDL